MNKEKLNICLRLVKAGHITEDEFVSLMQTEKEYVWNQPITAPITTPINPPYISWSKVNLGTDFTSAKT